MTIRATAGASPRWGIPEDCLEADHMIDARTKTGTAPDEHSDRREPADQRMLTDVSRLRSYRCTIKLAAAPTITVRRIHSHARSLTTGHESNPVRRRGTGLLRRFAPRNDDGLNQLRTRIRIRPIGRTDGFVC